MKIQILGPGCSKCKQLEANAAAAAKELGLEFEIEKISDFNVILSLGVMMTPSLVVDGKVKSVGKVPSVGDVKSMLK